MRTIEATVNIPADGRLVLQLPPDMPRGTRRIVLVIEEQGDVPEAAMADFPVDEYGPWPDGLSLRREELYEQQGR